MVLLAIHFEDVAVRLTIVARNTPPVFIAERGAGTMLPQSQSVTDVFRIAAFGRRSFNGVVQRGESLGGEQVIASNPVPNEETSDLSVAAGARRKNRRTYN